MSNSALTHPHYPPDSATEPAGYEDDFVLWVEHQVELMRLNMLDKLDLENVIEELESMGKSHRIELQHRLETLMMHLLKCEFQPEHRSGSWLGTLREQRSQIGRLLKTSPSLRKMVKEYADEAFNVAAKRASAETGLPQSRLPSTNPYSKEQLLDEDYLP